MKALVYQGPSQRKWEFAPDPAVIEPADAFVRIAAGRDLLVCEEVAVGL